MGLPLNLRIVETSRLVDGSGLVVEPVSLADAKNYCKVPATITADDALIADMIQAARILVETAASRTFVQASYQYVFDCFPPYNGSIAPLIYSLLASGVPNMSGAINWERMAVVFPFPPLISVDSITYVDPGGTTQTLDATPAANNVRIVAGTPGWMVPAFGKIFPITRPDIGDVTINFTAGMITSAAAVGNLPAVIRMAIRYLVGRMYSARTADLDIDEVVLKLLSPLAHAGAYA